MDGFVKYLEHNPGMIPIYSALLGFMGILISTIIKLVLDYFNNNKKINAEIIAKSRVEWIHDFRNIMSDFLTYGGYFADIHERMVYAKSKKELEEAQLEFKENYWKMQEKKNLLILYLPQYSYRKKEAVLNKEHVLIIKKMNELTVRINRLKENTSEQGIKYTFYWYRRNDVVNSLTKCTFIVSEYLKVEWEKAKKFR